MGYGDLPGDHDLNSLFGSLGDAESDALLAELGRIETRLGKLAEEASVLVGAPYSRSSLNVAGSLSGGAFSNDAGDLWFEIHRSPDEQLRRWLVTASIIVPCDREAGRQTRGYACTHNLLDLESYAFSPTQAVAMLSEHVETLSRDLRHRLRRSFLAWRMTASLHRRNQIAEQAARQGRSPRCRSALFGDVIVLARYQVIGAGRDDADRPTSIRRIGRKGLRVDPARLRIRRPLAVVPSQALLGAQCRLVCHPKTRNRPNRP